MNLYSLGTLWLSLSVLFFCFNFVLQFLDVVTLGGLVAGSFMLGTWSLLLELFLLKLEKLGLAWVAAVKAKDPQAPVFSQSSRWFCKFIFLYALNLAAVFAIVHILPGYEISKTNILAAMLCVYSALHLEMRKWLADHQ